MKSTILFLASVMTMTASAQDLTGTWIGSGGGAGYAKLVIVRVNNMYIGYTYDEGMGHCTCNYRGTFDSSRQKLKGINDGVIEKTALHSQSRYNLNYVAFGDREELRGTVSAKSVGAKILSFGLPMPVHYTKVSDKVDTTVYMINWLQKTTATLSPASDSAAVTIMPIEPGDTATAVIDPGLITPISADPIDIGSIRVLVATDSIIREKNKRSTDTLSVIYIQEKELMVKVLDNGIVDGDTVSILHNGKLIAESLSVSTKPFEFRIKIEKEDELQEIILVAHNLGSIAPNTALILIQTASKEYRLTASTDLKKNAMIIFKFQE
jgi:hypothetical protein